MPQARLPLERANNYLATYDVPALRIEHKLDKALTEELSSLTANNMK